MQKQGKSKQSREGQRGTAYMTISQSPSEGLIRGLQEIVGFCCTRTVLPYMRVAVLTVSFTC